VATTSRHLVTAADAAAALDYFNAFHDGFIRELALGSHDRFEARGVQALSGRLDLEIVFAHYNYREGEPPADQLVRARFRQVAGLVLDLAYRHGEWSIDSLGIEGGSRPGPGGEEACLVASLWQHRLEEGAWGRHEAVRFTFREAEIEELAT
jgi:hypothetical protein